MLILEHPVSWSESSLAGTLTSYPLEPHEGWKGAIMAKTETAIHRSNRDLHVAQMGRFLFWAKDNLEEAWKEASSERDESPWKLQALRSREGRAVAASIRAIHLDALRKAEAKLASLPKVSPARRPAQLAAKAARERFSEIEAALSPRRRRRK